MSEETQQDSPKAIHIFTREPFTPTETSEAAGPSPCELSLLVLAEAKEQVERGRITHINLVGLCDGEPVAIFVPRADLSVAELAGLNLAIDTLKHDVFSALGAMQTDDLEGEE